MKLKDAVALMKEQGLIDESEVYAYGQKASVLGGLSELRQMLCLYAKRTRCCAYSTLKSIIHGHRISLRQKGRTFCR